MEINFNFKGGHQVYESFISFDNNQELVVKFADTKMHPLKLKNVLVFPGLINSHDHLEFNLFPFLGNKIYADYTAWGGDIHANNKQEINAVLAIPLPLRIKWGIFKNLICGVTHIVHHGGHHDLIRTFNYPVFLNYQYLHALETEPLWKIKLNLPSHKYVMIHTGEGTNRKAYDEINKLISYNVFNRKLIGIHAIQMDEQQSKKFKALIWCPDSNLKLYGKTARVDLLKHHTPILFGTDSTVSASPSLWDQLRNARRLNLLSDIELFESLVHQPLNIFQEIVSNGNIIARKKTDSVWNSFFEIDPEDVLIVTIDNKTILIDQSLLDTTPLDYIPIQIGKSIKLIQHAFGTVVHELEDMGLSLPLHVKSI